MFVNAVALRNAMHLDHGPILPSANVEAMRTAYFLFASAYNSFLTFIASACYKTIRKCQHACMYASMED